MGNLSGAFGTGERSQLRDELGLLAVLSSTGAPEPTAASTALDTGHNRSFAQLAFDCCLGASVLGASVARLVRSSSGGSVGQHAEGVLAAMLGVTVAVLLAIRTRENRETPIGALLAALPSLLVAGLLVSDSTTWQLSALSLGAIGVGALWTLASFVTLGRSFAILPARRELVTHGPYRIVRHPAYLGELTMLAGYCLSARGPLSWFLLFAVVGSLLPRMLAEEALFSQDDDYRRYKKDTPYRLLPFVF